MSLRVCSGIKHVIFPKGNKPDWEILEPYVREGIHAHFVDQYSDVYELCFGTRLERYEASLSQSAPSDAGTSEPRATNEDNDDEGEAVGARYEW